MNFEDFYGACFAFGGGELLQYFKVPPLFLIVLILSFILLELEISFIASTFFIGKLLTSNKKFVFPEAFNSVGFAPSYDLIPKPSFSFSNVVCSISNCPK